MATNQNEHILHGRLHQYRLGAGIGRRVFRAVDECGLPWAVKIATRETLLAQMTLACSLPKDVLPRVQELSHLSGNRLTFLVSEYVAGFTLADLISEGRCLSPSECRKVLLDITVPLRALKEKGYVVMDAATEDVAFDPALGRWRLLSPGRLMQSGDDRYAVRWLTGYLWQAMGGGSREQLPCAVRDRRLETTLSDGRFGLLTLKDLEVRLSRRFPWGPFAGLLALGAAGFAVMMLR